MARLRAFALILIAACSRSGGVSEQPTPQEPVRAAPWQGNAVAASAAPAVYTEVWSKAENRETCALVALTQHGQSGATPRAATFSGGWAVAYDLPNQRSAFGIAGTGVEPTADTYDAWPHKRTWADGSRVGYGPEAHTGPNQLAYLRIAGQRCLYNVWSRLSVEHLESLLEGIRFVR